MGHAATRVWILTKMLFCPKCNRRAKRPQYYNVMLLGTTYWREARIAACRIERVPAEIKLFELAVRLDHRETCAARTCVRILYMITRNAIVPSLLKIMFKEAECTKKAKITKIFYAPFQIQAEKIILNNKFQRNYHPYTKIDVHRIVPSLGKGS